MNKQLMIAIENTVLTITVKDDSVLAQTVKDVSSGLATLPLANINRTDANNRYSRHSEKLVPVLWADVPDNKPLDDDMESALFTLLKNRKPYAQGDSEIERIRKIRAVTGVSVKTAQTIITKLEA